MRPSSTGNSYCDTRTRRRDSEGGHVMVKEEEIMGELSEEEEKDREKKEGDEKLQRK